MEVVNLGSVGYDSQTLLRSGGTRGWVGKVGTKRSNMSLRALIIDQQHREDIPDHCIAIEYFRKPKENRMVVHVDHV